MSVTFRGHGKCNKSLEVSLAAQKYDILELEEEKPWLASKEERRFRSTFCPQKKTGLRGIRLCLWIRFFRVSAEASAFIIVLLLCLFFPVVLPAVI